jgi:hypothetical protein
VVDDALYDIAMDDKRDIDERRQAAKDAGCYFIELKIRDASGVPLGGSGPMKPETLERDLVEMARIAANFCTAPHMAEQRERFGFTPQESGE